MATPNKGRAGKGATKNGDAAKGEEQMKEAAARTNWDGPATARPALKVLVVSPEIFPLAKTGGLADVAGSLPLALRGLGCDVRVAMPLYRKVRVPASEIATFDVPMGPKFLDTVRCAMPAGKEPGKGPVWEVTATAVVKQAALGAGVPAYLVENRALFDRDSLYGYGDDMARFGFFSRAVLEFLDRGEWKPDVIHCNDWQSAMVPTCLKLFYKPAGRLVGVGTLLTVHNLEYQGNFDRSAIDVLGLGWGLYNMEGIEFYGQVSLMKAGILYSDMVNTVSEMYAREIQTPEYGARLDGVLRANSAKVRGILNGLDYDVWDPEKDDALEQRFGTRSAGLRQKNKAALQRSLGLREDPGAFLLGFIGRLAVQKGIDILVPAIGEMLDMGCQLVALGTGDDYYMQKMAQIADADRERLSVMLKFDDRMARQIYGGCDAFLMPSRYEPCGLGQMISFRYGAVPIVRRTGGLADTVTDASVSEEGTGFVFNEYSTEGLVSAVMRARNAYSERHRWNALIMKGMAQDFSWRASAGKYLDTYREISRRVS